MYELSDTEAFPLLTAALGDTPHTAIAGHLLRRGLCRAFVMGDPASFRALVVQSADSPDEPCAFGYDPAAVWEVLRTVEGWFCVNVDARVAQPLGALIQRDLGVPVRYYRDLHFTLMQPVAAHPNADVRLMTAGDVPMLEAAPEVMRPSGFGSPSALLQYGFCACAVVDGQVVALAQTYARNGQHADIGVSTLPDYRQRGYATAAAALVAREVQAAGQTPVWSTGEDNTASQRVARKLGFQQIEPRVYVILEN